MSKRRNIKIIDEAWDSLTRSGPRYGQERGKRRQSMNYPPNPMDTRKMSVPKDRRKRQRVDFSGDETVQLSPLPSGNEYIDTAIEKLEAALRALKAAKADY